MKRRLLRRLSVRYGVPAGLATGAVALVSTVAFACTAVMGPLTITPNSGHAGTTIVTSAQGLKPGATYGLHFTTSINGDCMSFKAVTTLGKIKTNGSGAWSSVSSVIPASASMGAHGLCGMELNPVKGQTGTAHETFTVI